MHIISSANATILNILSKFSKPAGEYRLSKYCVNSSVDEGELIFNLLTREVILLTKDEFLNCENNDYLRKQWFVVPHEINEKEIASFCKTVILSHRKDLSIITGYTIFPTTDCNARCFYCFEKGRSVATMTEDTARKVAQYIKTHCGNKEVKIRWFGGEPLMNANAINIICECLREYGVKFSSTMVSNGLLFSDKLIEKATTLWNLEAVQITLDGTEKVYNKVKAYVNCSESAYNIVMSNIQNLTNAGIKVLVRMNMDLYNSDDLLCLSKELATKFSGNKNIRAYAHHIFQEGVAMGEMHTLEEWLKRDQAIAQIEKVLSDAGMYKIKSLSTKLRNTHCMADCGSSVTIVPDGHIGLCEHHSESEFIGHIDSDNFDKDAIACWRELIPEIPECDDCFYYPECLMLKKCTNSSVCYPQLRVAHRRKIVAKMGQLYEKWLSTQQ